MANSDSDDEIDNFVGMGVEACVQVVSKAQSDHQVPYSICLLLSLSEEQLTLL